MQYRERRQFPFQLQAHRAGQWVLISQHQTEIAARRRAKMHKTSARPNETTRVVSRGSTDYLSTRYYMLG